MLKFKKSSPFAVLIIGLLSSGCEHKNTPIESAISSHITGSFQGETSQSQTIDFIVTDGRLTRFISFSPSEYFGRVDDPVAVIKNNQFSFSYGKPESDVFSFSISGTFKGNEFFGTINQTLGKPPQQLQKAGSWHAKKSSSILFYPNPFKLNVGKHYGTETVTGIGPFTIVLAPNSEIAQVSLDPLNPSLLLMAGIKEGNTAMVIQDSSTPPLVGTIEIAVTAR